MFSETLVSSCRYVSYVLLLGYFATIRKDNVCNCDEIHLVWVCSRLNNLYVFSLYCSPDLDNLLYDCLLSSISNIQQEDSKTDLFLLEIWMYINRSDLVQSTVLIIMAWVLTSDLVTVWIYFLLMYRVLLTLHLEVLITPLSHLHFNLGFVSQVL